MEPGLSNVFARYAVDHLFSTVDELGTRDGSNLQVLGEDGEPLQSESELTDPDTVAPEEKRAWYDDAWDSVKLAGHPPTQAPPVPLRKIDGSDQQPE